VCIGRSEQSAVSKTPPPQSIVHGPRSKNERRDYRALLASICDCVLLANSGRRRQRRRRSLKKQSDSIPARALSGQSERLCFYEFQGCHSQSAIWIVNQFLKGYQSSTSSSSSSHSSARQKTRGNSWRGNKGRRSNLFQCPAGAMIQ
jgi:hypothetical protein